MKIIKITRSKKPESPAKIYGEILGDHGKVYKFAYLRGSFRGWVCTCENFMFEATAKRRHCKHLKFVREKYGRYGERVI